MIESKMQFRSGMKQTCFLSDTRLETQPVEKGFFGTVFYLFTGFKPGRFLDPAQKPTGNPGANGTCFNDLRALGRPCEINR